MNDHFRIEPKKKRNNFVWIFERFTNFSHTFRLANTQQFTRWFCYLKHCYVLHEIVISSALFFAVIFCYCFYVTAFVVRLRKWKHPFDALAVYFIKFVNDVFSIVILPILNIWKQFFFAFFSAQLHFIVRKNKERRERERKKTFQSVDNYTAFTWEHQLWRRKKWTFFSLFIQISIGLKCSIWNFDTNEPNDTHSIEIHFD